MVKEDIKRGPLSFRMWKLWHPFQFSAIRFIFRSVSYFTKFNTDLNGFTDLPPVPVIIYKSFIITLQNTSLFSHFTLLTLSLLSLSPQKACCCIHGWVKMKLYLITLWTDLKRIQCLLNVVLVKQRRLWTFC